MERQTQKDWVAQQLREQGEISRNYCLQNYISRLGSIMNRLKNEGWQFETTTVTVGTQWGKAQDYVYRLKSEA